MLLLFKSSCATPQRAESSLDERCDKRFVRFDYDIIEIDCVWDVLEKNVRKESTIRKECAKPIISCKEGSFHVLIVPYIPSDSIVSASGVV